MALGARRDGVVGVGRLAKGRDMPQREAQGLWPLLNRQTHLFLRLLNMNYDISGFYSLDGKTWTPFETSSYVNDGRRLSLYATGSGEVAFRNLRYHGLDYGAIGR